jgi:hypothetical protein
MYTYRDQLQICRPKPLSGTIATLELAESLIQNVDFPSVDDVNANARLIAAAPELLEALEHCLAYFEAKRPQGCGIADDRDCSPYNDAVEALAKARGES